MTPLLERVIAAAHAGGRAAMRHYSGELHVELKSDRSPVTAADLAAQNAIVAALRDIDATPVVSEESYERADTANCWLVDPIDGTKEFIKRTGEFTVNIALVRDGEPVLGVVYAPALELTYAAERRSGSWKNSEPLQPRTDATPPYRMVVSRDHAAPEESDLARRLDAVPVPKGSTLKLCAVAEGSADFYARIHPTMEWDTAAAQCVVECAGGFVVDREGNRLRYGKAGARNPSVFAFADRRLFELALR